MDTARLESMSGDAWFLVLFGRVRTAGGSLILFAFLGSKASRIILFFSENLEIRRKDIVNHIHSRAPQHSSFRSSLLWNSFNESMRAPSILCYGQALEQHVKSIPQRRRRPSSATPVILLTNQPRISNQPPLILLTNPARYIYPPPFSHAPTQSIDLLSRITSPKQLTVRICPSIQYC